MGYLSKTVILSDFHMQTLFYLRKRFRFSKGLFVTHNQFLRICFLLKIENFGQLIP